uniref:Uncharacterized protein n=1 Tax=viral metagenome TaxID=1070528 RepID=A0A6C0AWB7_9ZZZZ|tara:strand:+ start:2311 stop:2694 length:384 start_codon:yes stop_codon:yes gene_type:complete
MNGGKVKKEIMTMGSNQINIDGNIVSKTNYEGYSHDGKNININYYNNGKQGRLENLSLNDFSKMLNNPFFNDDEEIHVIKKNLNPKHKKYMDMLKILNKPKKKYSTDKTKKSPKGKKSDKTKSKKRK